MVGTSEGVARSAPSVGVARAIKVANATLIRGGVLHAPSACSPDRLEPQGVERYPHVSLFGVSALIVPVLDAAGAVVGEPGIDLDFPGVRQLVFAFEPPCGVGDVFERG